MNYKGIDGLLNTIDNMEVIVNNVRHDDDSVTVTGVDWFKFNNAVTTNMYASGNHWIGIGANTEHLKICRRDGTMYYLYRQEGTIWNYYRFLKIRWEGYTYLSSTSSEYSLKYEFILISNGDMFLNVIQTPTNGSYIGSSTFTCGNNTISLDIPINSAPQISFYHQDSEGKMWNVVYEKMNVQLPYDCKYLLKDNAGKYYTIKENALTEIQVSALNAQVFKDFGVDTQPDGNLIKTIANPKLLYWQDSQEPLLPMTVNIIAIPPDQFIVTPDYDMTDPTIKGIENVVVDASADVLFAFSFDSGVSWKIYESEEWKEVSETTGMTTEQVQAITAEQWAQVATTGKYRIRILLRDAGYMNNVQINYKN